MRTETRAVFMQKSVTVFQFQQTLEQVKKF
jgi:hypothetical protein